MHQPIQKFWPVLAIWFGCSVLGLTAARPAAKADDSPAVPAEVVIKPEPSLPPSLVSPKIQSRPVDWTGLAKQSGRFLAIMHAFRYATEPGTRNGGIGLGRPYLKAVGNLHGWADGDPFYVNYVGHPMQGAVAAQIWSSNDPGYNSAEFGRNAAYWKAKLRGTAFAWGFSEQFEIGPISEASIGRIQTAFPQQGFVDHVITPSLGLVWMLAEDSIDKFVIKKAEAQAEQPWLRAIMRVGLNPTRTLANLVGGKAPWHRDTRAGVRLYSGEMSPSVSVKSSSYEFSNTDSKPARAPFEFTVNSIYRQFQGAGARLSCAGGGASGAFRLTPEWLLAIDISGCKLSGLQPNASGDSLTYLIGSRWVPDGDSRWSPYAQVLVGGTKITVKEILPEKKRSLQREAPAAGVAASLHEDYTLSEEANGFAISAGAGLDLKLNRALAFRVASLEYSYARTSRLALMNFSNSLQVTTGVVLRIGTW